MAVDFVTGVFRITNLFIAIFILLYAYLFLVKTSKRNERKPWDYLFGSAFIFLLYQIYSLVTYFSGADWIWDTIIIGSLVEFLFSGLVLLAFVSQHDLILRSPLILISRKSKEMGRTSKKEESEKVEEEKKELPEIKKDSEEDTKEDSEEK